jgi:serine/threonine protein kinase/Flp pilus assembly protein TadD
MKDTLPLRVRFDAFELDLKSGELHKSGQQVVFQDQPFQILRMLIEHAGAITTREEIQQQLWPNDPAAEFDRSLNAAINQLYAALGDSADHPKYIETVARRGYRLLIPVERGESTSGEGAALVTADPASLTGQTFSQYRVLGIVGSGGMGVVYEAEDLKLGRRVALKFLPQGLGADARVLERFEREARAASALEHPNICPIYQFGEHEGRPFIVMQLLRGQTLKGCLAAVRKQASASSQAKALPLDQVLDIAIQIAEGLEAAHEKGIIHRDIKPANIFLTDKGVVKILDFGLAKLLQRSAQEEVDESAFSSAATQLDDRSRWRIRSSEPGAPAEAAAAQELSLSAPGVTVGTLAYMSPEQVRNEKLDAQTDLFSFGLVLYEIATGQRAFSGPTPEILHQEILNGTAAPARGLNPELPSSLEKVIHKAMEKDRGLRYQRASEIRADLNRIKLGIQSREQAAGLRRKLLAAMAVVLIAAIAGGLYWRSRHGTKLTEKDTIVLCDFTNTTGDSVFDDTLKQALAIQLEQSPFLTVISDRKVSETLKLMDRPANERVTRQVAEEVCLRNNSKVLLQGSIAPIGDHYLIVMKAMNCQTGDTIASADAEVEKRNQVVKALGQAGNQLRKKLGESRPSVEKFNTPLEEATTSSLEALQAFSQSNRMQFEKGDAAALPYLKHAIELDPNFARAYAALGMSYNNMGEASLAIQNFKKAYELRKGVSQKERLMIEAMYYSEVTGEREKAIQSYTELIQGYPGDASARTNVGNIYAVLGEYEKAVDELREALRLAPDTGPAYVSLMSGYLGLNRLEDAGAVFEQARARKLDDTNLRFNRYILAFLQGDTDAMGEQVAWAAGKPGAEDQLFSAQSDTEAFYGRFAKAREFSQRAIASSKHADSPEAAAASKANEAIREAEIGNPSEARKEAGEALALSSGRDVEVMAALTLARAGEAAQAGKLATKLNQEFPLDTMMQNYSLPTIQAAIDLAKNNPRGAIQILQVTTPYELGSSPSFGSLYPVYVRGLAYLKSAQGQLAAAEFHKMLDHKGIVGNFVLGALAHLQLGRAQAMMGDKAAARKSFQDFFALWKNADPEIPILKQAKVDYAELK